MRQPINEPGHTSPGNLGRQARVWRRSPRPAAAFVGGANAAAIP
jgi:hypothetical protein